MNEGANIVERLRPIRLPADFASFSFPDMLAFFGAGLIAGLLIVLLLRLFVVRQPAAADRARRAIAAFGSEPAQIRLLKLARLRAELLPGAGAPSWRSALYQPDLVADFETVESEILSAVRDGTR